MEFQTPGVYVREVDSGSKPIASVPTSIPGFLGLFHHTPATDAVAVSASGSGGELTGKVLPQLVDASGAAAEHSRDGRADKAAVTADALAHVNV